MENSMINDLIKSVEALVYYSQIYTVKGVQPVHMPDHETAWKNAQHWIWDNCKADEMGNYHLKEAQPGARWVKASERLPGYKLRVKWRDGNDHSYATDGEISMFEMEKPNLEGWEWLDEQPAAGREEDAAFAMLNYIQDELFRGSDRINGILVGDIYRAFKQQKNNP